jgi:hypothetical protein
MSLFSTAYGNVGSSIYYALGLVAAHALGLTPLVYQVGPDEWAEPLATYSRRAVAHGGRELTPNDARSPAPLRLYRATAVDQYVLDEHDQRVPVSL